MSIATEITRLQTAKANLKTQIEAKGVSVPSTATIDTYATYVQEIPQGGGSGETKDYFKITNRTATAGTITFTAPSTSTPIKLKASSDGTNWTTYEMSATTTFTLPANGYVMFDGGDNTTLCPTESVYWCISANVEHNVSGDITSLVDPKKALSSTFSNLFYRDNKLVDASGLILPAMKLSEYAYYRMFRYCPMLTSAPALPATALAKQCYAGMFQGCTALTQAPSLPSLSAPEYCYGNMFSGCTSLTVAPELPAAYPETGAYSNMFRGCAALASITCLAINHVTGVTANWVTDIQTQGIFYCASGKTNTWSQGNNGYPSTWSIQEYSPQTGVEIVINDAAPCIGDPYMGECLDVSAFTYSIVSIDPNDGETELETFASATIENAMYGESVRFEITDSATTSGITSITLDDSDGIKLTIVGEFDTANTYAVKCSTVGIDDGITRYGYAMDGDSNSNFDLSEDISVTPDFPNELMPLRTLTIEGIPTVPNEATHIEVTDDDKFGIEIALNGEEMNVETSVWTGDCWDDGGGIEGDCRITVTYDETEQTITIAADWDTYEGEGSGEYNLRMKAETDSCTVEEGDEGTYSLQWSGNELSKTITFDGGTCTPFE